MGGQSEIASLCSVEAEAALLGALMIDNTLFDGVRDIVGPEHFFEHVHGRVFAQIEHEVSLGRAATSVTLRPHFEKDPDMAELGGPAYLAQLTGGGATLVGVRDFARQIYDFAIRRSVVGALLEVIERAGDLDRDRQDLLADADGALGPLLDSGTASTEISAGEAARLLIKQFDQPVTGSLCGLISDVDRLLGPARPKKLLIVGGRPGMGKTAFAVTYSLGVAAGGDAVLFISLEMGADELAGRMVADLCWSTDGGVPYDVINERRPSRDQMRKIAAAQERMNQLPIQIVDRSALTSSQLDTLIRRWKRRFAAAGLRLGLVVVDYLQLMRADHRTNSPYEAVSEVSRRLKESAKAHDVPIMAVAQLSRAVEQRQDKRPMLSDLKESGQLEQDADIVLFLYRAAYYAEAVEPDRGTAEHEAWQRDYDLVRDRIDFILAKRRDGKKGKRTGYYFPDNQAMRGSDIFEMGRCA